jgi:SAM-dependent methyltransferase
VGPAKLQGCPVTERLYGRLDPEDVATIEAGLTADEAKLWNEATPLHRKVLALAFGVHSSLAGVIAKTGLIRAAPPLDIHAMDRAQETGGSHYYADLVVEALTRVGGAPQAGARALDFGCSSGRIVRVLAAAYPEVEWHGCDPIVSSIDWARSNLTGVNFSVSSEDPPLPYSDGLFDFVFAISIWSHFSEPAALRWFAEMRRVIKPGGHLVFTTHGFHSVAYYARHRYASEAQLAEVVRTVYAAGFWFGRTFGESGDHGIVSPDWGMACLTAEWLLAHLCPEWRVVEFAPGRVKDNQDLFVLARR